METLSVVIAFLPCYCCWWWWYNRKSVLVNWPIFGMLPGLLLNVPTLHDKVTSIMKQSGFTFLFKGPWFSDLEYLMTADPLNVHHVLTKNFANYEKGPELRKIMEFVGGGIIATDGDDWKIRRKVIRWLTKDHDRLESAVVKSTKMELLNNLSPILQHFSSNVVDLDLQDVFQRFTFDTICNLSLGIDPKCLSVGFPHIPYAKAFDELGRAVIKRHLLPSTYWKFQQKLQIGDERKFTQAWKMVDGFIYECISNKSQKLEECRNNINQIDDGINDLDLLAKLMTADEDEEEIADVEKTNKFLRDVAFSILLAGKDTLASALTWFFYLIATNPDAEENILDEIKANFDLNENNDEVFFDATNMRKLVYLHGAISETLRLYPPVPFERKIAIASDTLPSGHRVEPNTKVLFLFYSMGRSEEIWGKDCLEFKPERWITNKGKNVHVASNKFVAFNAGPRACLGRDISFLQIKVIACWILWTYRFEIVQGHHVSPVNSMVLNMKHGLKVKVVKRSVLTR